MTSGTTANRHTNDHLWIISTYGCAAICFIISTLFIWELSPQTGRCPSNRYQNLVQLASSVVGVFIVSIYATWARFSPARSKAEVEKMSLIGKLFSNFFDRWFISAIFFTAFTLFVQFTSSPPVTTHSWQETGQTVAAAVEIWASSRLFNETVQLFKDKCPDIGVQWFLNVLPQHILILTATGVSLMMIIVTALDADATTEGSTLVKFSLFFRLSIRLYQVISFSILVKIINKFHRDLLDAVVNASVTGKTQVVDSPFHNDPLSRVKSTEGVGVTVQNVVSDLDGYHGNARNGSAHSVSKDSLRDNKGSTDTVNSIRMSDLPRNDYTQIFKEAERILDLLRMVVTFSYISAMQAIVEIEVNITRTFSTDILDTTLRLTVTLLPWVYFVKFHSSHPSVASVKARNGCIEFLLVSMYFVMAMMGGYLGCDFLQTASFNHSREKQFLIYIVKTTALPTTLSLAFLVLTSPGVRNWAMLPQYVQMTVAPLIWLPQYTLQELHESFGWNFGVMGLIHAIGWIIMLCLGMFTIFTDDYGVLIALITGFVMLLFAIKLLWPPGRNLPFFRESTASKLVKRLDAYLRDSKYGSMHVYLAYFTLIAYCLHGIFAMKGSTNWYFFTVMVCFVVSLRSHPVKRYWFYRPMHALGYKWDKYTILSKQVVEIRDRKALCAVTLILQLPSNCNIQHFKGGGDVIHVQNRSGYHGWPLFNFLTRSLETTHYFSVVSIDFVDDKDKIITDEDERNNGASYLRNLPATSSSLSTASSSSSSSSMRAEGTPSEAEGSTHSLSSILTSGMSILSYQMQERNQRRNQKHRIRVQLMIQRTSRPIGASSALVEETWKNSTTDVEATPVPGSGSGTNGVYFDLRVLGFVKSHSLEAMHLPCVIAFGYESGSAAFCSMLRQRMKMRTHIENSHASSSGSLNSKASTSPSVGVRISALTDLCVIWCQFMKRPRGRDIRAQDIITACKELVALQEYLYSNSGGRGVKMLFVCTGVPQEWTPDPECIVHRTKSLESEVARALNVSLSPEKDALMTDLSNESGRVLWGSSTPFTEVLPKSATPSTAEATTILSTTPSPGTPTSLPKLPVSPTAPMATSTAQGARKVSTASAKSSMRSSSVTHPVGLELKRVSFLERSSIVRHSSFLSQESAVERVMDSVRASDATRSVSGIPEDDAEYDLQSPMASVDTDMEPLLRETIMSNPGTLASIQHPFQEDVPAFRGDNVQTSAAEQTRPDASSPSTSTSAVGKATTSPLEMLVHIQQHPESWIPLRNALGSHWKHFKKLLDYRIGAACSWLNSPQGPDFTSLFITEHSSDVAMLRDFKYSEVYDGKYYEAKYFLWSLTRYINLEVNAHIIQHQIRFSKNPINYCAGCFDTVEGGDQDPLDATPIEVGVLYSGDYATSKREHLKNTVERIQAQEHRKKVPATLSFIPDA
jgi:hypothetical protein